MKKIICLIILASSLLAGSGSGQIHVGPGQSYPSIFAASHSKNVHPGDTIFVHAGIYSDTGYGIDSLIGSPSKWIVIMNYPGDSVSIHVQYTFQHAQYLKIKGLNFFGNDTAYSANVFHQLFFDYMYDCFIDNHDIIIDSCNFTELNNTGKTGSGACLKFTGTDNFVVTNCLFSYGTNIADGISMNADRNGRIESCKFINMPADGSHCKGGSKNITYQRNLFINCTAGGLDIGGDTGPQFFCPLGAAWEADSIKVYANIFIGGNTGIRLGSCHNSFIINNTCFKMLQFAFRSLNTSSNNIYLANNVIANNIFTTYSTNHIYLNASNDFTYNTEFFKNNLFHDYLNPDPMAINLSEMPGVNDTLSIIGDPLFTDTLHGDFSLKTGSPAIGAGVLTAEPIMDFAGKIYSSGKRSIGAIETIFDTADECTHLRPWTGYKPQNNAEFRQQYDSLRKYVELCANDISSFHAFPHLDADVQEYAPDDTTRYDVYRDWLISVLYLNTKDPFYFCVCLQSIGGTYVYGKWAIPNAWLAVIKYVIDNTGCDHQGLIDDYNQTIKSRHESWQTMHDLGDTTAEDTVLPSLDQLRLGFLLKKSVPGQATPLSEVYLASFTSSPNPFKKETTLEFMLNRMTYIQVAVYDELGKWVWGDSHGYSLEAGTHQIHLDGSSFPSGVFYARISTGFGEVKTVKLVHEK